jgi:diguanylate cyclase (GGDEF)-like protein
VSLFLHDPELEIRRLLEQLGAEPAALGDLVFVDRPARLESLFGRRRAPRLGPFLPGAHADLFPVTDQSLASVALLPLDREGRLFGSYNLGSLRRERFPREAGSDFLRHLAAIVGVCLEMAVTRERLNHLGLTDALTGVNNRRFFDQRLPEEIARAQRAGSAVSCLFIDVDHFKRLNDSYGHQAGDRALRAVAELVRESLRRSDVLTRYGGEEFAAILPQAGLQDATEIAERVRERVAEAHLRIGEAELVSVSVSIGVATLDAWPPGAEPDDVGAQLVEAADRGVYRAKAAGRNQVVAELLA